MESSTQEITLNCILSSENKVKKTKIGSYVTVTLFHGDTPKSEKHTKKLDDQGNASIQIKDVNVETDNLRLQVFKHCKFWSDRHVGTVDVHMSELVPAGGQPSSLTYELVKLRRNTKKGELKLSCKLSNPVKESKGTAAAIGNDVGLFKMLPSFRTPIVSISPYL